MEFKNVAKTEASTGKAVTLEKVRPSFVNLDSSWHQQRNKGKATLQALVEAPTDQPAAVEKVNSSKNSSITPENHKVTPSAKDGASTKEPSIAKDMKESEKDSKTEHPPESEKEMSEAPTTVPAVTYSRKGWLMPYEHP